MRPLTHDYVVAFHGRRDYYQVAVALAAEGRLERLVTDLYCPDLLARNANLLPGAVRHKVMRRRAAGLSSRFVSLGDTAAVMLSDADRRLRNRSYRVSVGATLGRRAALHVVAKKAGAVIYGYNWEAFLNVAALRASSGPRLVFLSEPLPSQLRSALLADRLRTGIRGGRMPVEDLAEADVRQQEAALLKADGALVPSTFVRDGLVSRGMAAERVAVVPYGGDLSVRLDSHRERPVSIDSERHAGLRLLWIGQLTYLKGAHHLAAALRALGRTDVSLTVVSYHRGTSDPFANLPCSVRWLPRASAGDLASIFEMHDVLVMPTLAEAFGLVYVEALYAGLPVIASRSSGGPDVISDGENGFLIDAGRVDILAEVIRRLVDDPTLVASLKRGARARGRQWTWDRFRRGVISAMADFETILQ